MLKSVRIFVKVCDLGSFSKASAVLNMAPSSVARVIDGLEEELGVSLFKRSTRQLTLTEEGLVFLESSEQLVEQTDQLLARFNRSSEQPSGLLRLSVVGSFGRLCIAPLLPEFLSLYPDVTIQLELENRVVDLASEEIDIAIRMGQPADSNFKARRLVKNDLVVCASPEYLSNNLAINIPDDLADHNCLVLHRNRQQSYWHFQKGQQERRVRVKGNLTSTGGTPLIEAALQGLGVVHLPRWMVNGSIIKGDLVECLSDWSGSLDEDGRGELYAIYMDSKFPKPARRALLDFLVERLPGCETCGGD